MTAARRLGARFGNRIRVPPRTSRYQQVRCRPQPQLRTLASQRQNAASVNQATLTWLGLALPGSAQAKTARPGGSRIGQEQKNSPALSRPCDVIPLSYSASTKERTREPSHAAFRVHRRRHVPSWSASPLWRRYGTDRLYRGTACRRWGLCGSRRTVSLGAATAGRARAFNQTSGGAPWLTSRCKTGTS